MIYSQCGVDKENIISGTDICGDCHEDNEHDTNLISSLLILGHTRHCAMRQVWGDGECECNRNG